MLHNIYFCFFMQKICVNTFFIVNVLLQFVYFAFQTVAHYQEQAPVHQGSHKSHRLRCLGAGTAEETLR